MPAFRRVPTLEVLEDRVLMSGDDIFEENDTKAVVDARIASEVASPNLGVITGVRTLNNLATEEDTEDWFKFQTVGVSTSAHSVRIDYEADNGNLQLEVLRGDGTSYVGWSYSGGDVDQVPLAGEASGTYYIRIFGATNPTYRLQIVAPQTGGDDAWEENDSKAVVDSRPVGAANSPNLGLLTAPKTITGLVMDDAGDWFRFETAGTSTSAHSVRLDYLAENGNLQLEVLRGDGVNYVNWSYSGGDVDQVPLAGERSGVYYVRVFAADAGNYNASYTLQITPPSGPTEDGYEENDSKAATDSRPAGATGSPNLGLVTGTKSILDLCVDDSADWYRFETSGAATTAHSVRIDYLSGDGNLQLEVLNGDGISYVGWSYSGGDFDQVSLSGSPAGTYYVHVIPADAGNHNARYNLQIIAPGETPNDPLLSLSVSPGTVSELAGSNAAVGTVTRTGPTTNSLVVNLSSGDMTEATVPTTVTIPAGQSAATFPIAAVRDPEADGTQGVTIRATAAGFREATAGLNVMDAGQVQFGLGSYLAGEADGTATVRVTRVGGGSGAATVRLTASPGSALDGVDFVAASQTLSFADGETTIDFPLTLLNDSVRDGNRTVVLTLTNATGASLGAAASAVLTLLDDEQPPVPPTPPAPPQPEAPIAGDVTSQVTIGLGPVRRTKRKGRFVQRVTVTNSTGRDLAGPLSLMLAGLPRGVRVVRLLPLDNDEARVPPGATVTFELEYVAPAAGRVRYVPRVFAG
jgi:hypothetical protein